MRAFDSAFAAVLHVDYRISMLGWGFRFIDLAACLDLPRGAYQAHITVALHYAPMRVGLLYLFKSENHRKAARGLFGRLRVAMRLVPGTYVGRSQVPHNMNYNLGRQPARGIEAASTNLGFLTYKAFVA